MSFIGSTFGTPECRRMFVDIPFVDCLCADCMAIRASRADLRRQAIWLVNASATRRAAGLVQT